MDTTTWKLGESRIAKRFNTNRTPLSGGSSRHTRSDTLHEDLFIEVKHGKEFPQPSLWKETVKLAKKENKVPLCVFLKKHDPNPIIMCRLDDIEKIVDIKRAGEIANGEVKTIPSATRKSPKEVIKKLEDQGRSLPEEFKEAKE